MTDKLIILKELKQHLQCNYGTNVKEVILFGSQAAGTAVNYSDFDVLIVLENDYNYKDENNILDLCYDMDLKYNIIIDAHLISRKEINSLRGKQPIYINALNSGIYA
ncbi:MAG: nucleotidyltransferase domain-containing protein [Bacteroidetes bacterium]|nr:nucleotidyltransferase domain-containing protein [Bacteroidota bacterium]